MRSNASGVGLYNSEYREYRNYNRGYGRGGYQRPYQSSSHRQPSPRPARRGDIFIEAGKLAVDYLVSHGLLSSDVLPGKGQNGAFRNSSVESQGVRSSQERELTNSGSRKFRNEDDQILSRSSSRERERRNGPSRNYNADLGQENGREGSSSERVTAMEIDDKNTSKDVGQDVHDNRSNESATNHDRSSQVEDDIRKSDSHVDVDSKTVASSAGKDDKELPKRSDDMNSECVQTIDSTSEVKMENESFQNELVLLPNEEKNESDPLSVSKEHSKSEDPSDFCGGVKDSYMNRSVVTPSSNEILSPNNVTGVQSDDTFGNAISLEPAYAVDQKNTAEAISFTDPQFSYDHNSRGLSELERCESITEGRGEKRGFEEENVGEGSKKAKRSMSFSQDDECLQLSDRSEKQSMSENKAAAPSAFPECPNQESFSDVAIPITSVEPAVGPEGQRQLFSSSFKICDLNLIGTSDINENHDMRGFEYPSISAPSEDAPSVINLSMNSKSLSSGYNDGGAARKAIEIIDLDGPSLQEGEGMHPSVTNASNEITTVETFGNHSETANQNPDGQDGYGFMITELLGNDVPNCSSVQPEINPLNNEMGLHQGEGLFCEDDSIYMSLGEIPISLLRGWEQPTTQGRNPFEL